MSAPAWRPFVFLLPLTSPRVCSTSAWAADTTTGLQVSTLPVCGYSSSTNIAKMAPKKNQRRRNREEKEKEKEKEKEEKKEKRETAADLEQTMSSFTVMNFQHRYETRSSAHGATRDPGESIDNTATSFKCQDDNDLYGLLARLSSANINADRNKAGPSITSRPMPVPSLSNGSAATSQVPTGRWKGSPPKSRPAKNARGQQNPGNYGKPLPVPKPLPAYLAQAEKPAKKLEQPQDLLLVLDLNGTLVHRPSRSNSAKLVARPGMEAFVQHILSSYTVLVWSSARPENVGLMCGKIFSTDQRPLLLAEWGRDRFGLNAQQYNLKLQVYKELEKVWRGFPDSHPRAVEGRRWDQTNTVLIDDSILKAASQPHNILEVPEWAGKQTSEAVLSQVTAYLDELRWYNDASSFMRARPFGVGRQEVNGVNFPVTT